MIKAIQTRYKGYHFRSRLEARWAVYMDVARIKWVYEAEGYELGGGLRYLPDFWLPEHKTFLEVKGVRPDKQERRKAQLLAYGRETTVCFAVGPPAEEANMLLSAFDYLEPRDNVEVYDYVVYLPWVKAASDAALSARFERGRRG